MNPEELRTRSLLELLEAERLFRQQAEQRLRSLNAVLTELAYRLSGEKLELLRKQDSTIPQSWTPEQWRAFFQGLTLDPQASGWGSKSNGNGHHVEMENLQKEIARLKAELTQARQRILELEQEKTRPTQEDIQWQSSNVAPPVIPKKNISPSELGYGYAQIPLLEWEQPAIPIRFSDRIRSGAATRRDAQLNERRKLLVLWLLSFSGISAQIEIGRLVSALENVSAEAGSVKRPIEALVNSNLLVSQTLNLYLERTLTRLVALRLSEEGKELCSYWGYPNAESEWERLLRLHEGDKQEGHTLAVLLFAAYARMRGWKVTILPDVQRSSARPDVLIESASGERWYVEVETGTREHVENAKWHNLAALQEGRVAVCARTAEERKVLAADCQQWHGVATDLESMVGTKLKNIKPGDKLWIQEW